VKRSIGPVSRLQSALTAVSAGVAVASLWAALRAFAFVFSPSFSAHLSDAGTHSLTFVPRADLILLLALALAAAFVARRDSAGPSALQLAITIAASFVVAAPVIFLPALVLSGRLPFPAFGGASVVVSTHLAYAGFGALLFVVLAASVIRPRAVAGV
jgi:hypothetical protein